LKRSEKSLKARIEAEEGKNARLRREENDLKTDPNYVEKVAREKLGLVKPGELIYRFEEDKQN
jgi:cell division protein FtsB